MTPGPSDSTRTILALLRFDPVLRRGSAWSMLLLILVAVVAGVIGPYGIPHSEVTLRVALLLCAGLAVLGAVTRDRSGITPFEITLPVDGRVLYAARCAGLLVVGLGLVLPPMTAYVIASGSWEAAAVTYPAAAAAFATWALIVTVSLAPRPNYWMGESVLSPYWLLVFLLAAIALGAPPVPYACVAGLCACAFARWAWSRLPPALTLPLVTDIDDITVTPASAQTRPMATPLGDEHAEPPVEGPTRQRVGSPRLWLIRHLMVQGWLDRFELVGSLLLGVLCVAFSRDMGGGSSLCLFLFVLMLHVHGRCLEHRRRLRLVAHLPFDRRHAFGLLAAWTLPTVAVFWLASHLFPPIDLVTYRSARRGEGQRLDVPVSAFRIAWDGAAPVITSSDGRETVTPRLHRFPGLSLAVYNPYELNAQASPRFGAEQVSRAFAAVYGVQIVPTRLEGLLEKGEVVDRSTLEQDYGPLRAGFQYPRSLALLLAVAWMAVLRASFGPRRRAVQVRRGWRPLRIALYAVFVLTSTGDRGIVLGVLVSELERVLERTSASFVLLSIVAVVLGVVALWRRYRVLEILVDDTRPRP